MGRGQSGRSGIAVSRPANTVAVGGNAVTGAMFQTGQDAGGGISFDERARTQTGNLTVTVNGQNVQFRNVPRTAYNDLVRARGDAADQMVANFRRRYTQGPAPAVGAGGQTTSVNAKLRRPSTPSSLIASAGFTPDRPRSATGTMTVRLKNGEIYQHTGISRAGFRGMMTGGSPGVAYNQLRQTSNRTELVRGSNNGNIPGANNNRGNRTSSRITANPGTGARVARAGARQEAAGQARIARNTAQSVRDRARRAGRALTPVEQAQIRRLETARTRQNRAARRLAG